jgi:hypothetical protein
VQREGYAAVLRAAERTTVGTVHSLSG